jgi:oligosaccharide reducing-end xylanase
MRKSYCLLIPFLFLTYYSADAQYQISTWYQQKSATVTYTFDGYNNTGSQQLSVALPLFDAYGYKVTLTTITDWISDWSDLKKAAENSHEIASLTVTHNSLAEQSDSSQEYELSESQRIINEQIPNAYCLTLAFPYCETGNMDLVKKYYICGRICSGVIEPSTPGDLFKISSIITGDQGSVYTSDHMNAKVELARESNGWCVFLIHGINDDGGYSPILSRHIKKHLAYMNENDSVPGQF